MSKMHHGTSATGGRAGRMSSGHLLAVRLIAWLCLTVTIPAAEAQEQEKAAPSAAPSGDSLTREGREKLTRELREHDDQAGRLFQQRRFAEARRHLERSLEILEQLYPKARFPQGHTDLPPMMTKLALIEMSLEQYPQALEHFQKSLAMIKSLARTGGPWREANLVFLADQLMKGGGRLHENLGRPEEAEHYVRLAIEVYDLIDPKTVGPDRRYGVLAAAWTLLSRSLMKQKRFTEAEAGYRRALEILEQLHPRENSKSGLLKAVALDGVGCALREAGKPSEAAETLRKALELWPKAVPLSDATREAAIFASLGSLARTLYDMHDLEAAESASREVLARARRVFGDRGAYSLIALRELGIVLRARGQFDGAERSLRESLTIARELFPEEKYPQGHPELAMTLGELASVHADKGDYGEAMRLIKRSIAMPVARNHLPVLMDKLASIHLLLGERKAARAIASAELKAHEQAYPEERFPGGHRDLATSMLRLAETYDEPEGTALVRLGQRKRNIESVGEAYRSALEMCRAQFPEKDYPDGHPALAEALWLTGRWTLNWNVDYGGKPGLLGPAKADCLRSLEMLEKLYPRVQFPLGHPVLAARLSEMGVLLVDLGEYEAALDFGRRGHEMSERLFPGREYPHGHPALAQALYNVGLIHVSRGISAEVRHDTARYCEDLRLAWNLLRRSQEISQYFLDVVLADCPEAQALNYRTAQPPALELMISIGSDVQIPGVEEILYDAVAASKAAPFRGARRRERLLRESTDPEVRSLVSRLKETRRHLAPLLIGATEADMDREGPVQRLAREKERLERAIAERLPRYGQGHEIAEPRASDLRKSLPPGTALVEFLLFRSCMPTPQPSLGGRASEKPRLGRVDKQREAEYQAFIIRPDAPTVRLQIGDPFAIDREINSWREMIFKQDPRSVETSSFMRDEVWRPIEERLGPATTTVLIAPDGQLARIPWAAIRGRGPGRILLEDYALAVVPHGLYAMEHSDRGSAGRPARSRFLAVGDVDHQKRPASEGTPAPSAKTRPVLHGGKRVEWPRLPGTRAELEAIVSVATTPDVIRLTGEAAATGQVLEQLPGARWAHLAVHGFFDDPDRFLNNKTLATSHLNSKDLNKNIEDVLNKIVEKEVMFADLGRGEARGRLPNSFYNDMGGIYRRERLMPFERNPQLFSGLVFAGANLPVPEGPDGILRGDGGNLTAETIAGLPLDDLDLVVLSACESGLGDLGYGLGVLGLQRAFHLAGVRDVVGTLWKIDDDATAALMRVFYHKLWVESKPPIEALREAQLSIYYSPDKIGPLARLRGPDFSKEVTVAGSPPAGSRSGRTPIKLWAGIVFSGPARPGTPAIRYNLADVKKGWGRVEEALVECREAIRVDPKDFEAHRRLGEALCEMDRLHDWPHDEGIHEFREAVRLKPDSAEAHYELGFASYENWRRDSRFESPIHKGDPELVVENDEGKIEPVEINTRRKLEQAVAEFRAAVRLKPQDCEFHNTLGNALADQKQDLEAISEFKTAIRLSPESPGPHTNLGNALKAEGRFDEALAEFREVIRLRPDSASARVNLGSTLARMGQFEPAIEVLRAAIRIDPKEAEAHLILGYIQSNLGRVDEAVASLRQGIQLDPRRPEAYNHLGSALVRLRRLDEAVAAFREEIRLEPKSPDGYADLGQAFVLLRRFDEAVTVLRQATQLPPDRAELHYLLGDVLARQRLRGEAILEYRKATQLQPDFGPAYYSLGYCLQKEGDWDGALASYRKAKTLAGSNSRLSDTIDMMINMVQRLAVLSSRLAAVLDGTDRPAHAAEAADFGQLASGKGRYAASAKFYSDAFLADPKLGDDLKAAHRYNAACSAALAGCGQDKADSAPAEVEKAKVRRLALDWLRADLVLRKRQLESNQREALAEVSEILNYWKADEDLACVRDSKALAKLPDKEQREWRALWADVDALEKKAQGKRPQP